MRRSWDSGDPATDRLESMERRMLWWGVGGVLAIFVGLGALVVGMAGVDALSRRRARASSFGALR